jgi:hypothetical protein
MQHHKTLRPVLVLSLLFSIVLGICSAQDKVDMKAAAANVVGLLEKSGHNYTKVKDGVWEINFTGDNLKDFSVRLALGDNILVSMAKVADRKDLKLEPELLTKLLELNHSLDSVKLALSEEMLYVRMDTHLRILDTQEMKYVIDQMSGATDEVYPHIKKFLVAK